VCREIGGARVAWLPADIDRRFARDQLPDHGDLLAQQVRWCLRGQLPFEVVAPGLIDCRLFRTSRGEGVLHLVNLNNPNAWRTPVQELVPTGPVRVRLKASAPGGSRVRALVSDSKLRVTSNGGSRELEIPSIADHEVIVIE
jgi:hypothetical protein